MRIVPTPVPGLLVLEPAVHRDERGFFMETWRDTWLETLGPVRPFVQDNHACSVARGVLRGLHFQHPPHAQGKLVWVSKGAVLDVAVDLRKGSPAYGHWHAELLSAENARRFYLPRGFAHGYMTLEPDTEFHYKVDNYYAPDAEDGIRWDDPDLAIVWPEIPPVLSDKDSVLPFFSSLMTPFIF